MPSPKSFGQRPLVTPPDKIDPATWVDMITLPRQVGRWIGDVDEGGGHIAQQAEAQTTYVFLANAAQKFENIPLISQICRATRDIPVTNPLREVAVFAKIEQTLKTMRNLCAPLEVNAYKLLLIEMAEAVARAAADNDEGSYNLMNGPTTGWYGLYPAILDNFVRFGRGPRVSTAEKLAINRLIDLMDAGEMVQKWQIGDPERPSVRVYS